MKLYGLFALICCGAQLQASQVQVKVNYFAMSHDEQSVALLSMTLDQKNETLIDAVKQCYETVFVRRLISSGANPLILSEGKPLTMLSGKLETIQMLIEESGVHVDAKDPQNGRTVLLKDAAYCLTYKMFEDNGWPHALYLKLIMKHAASVKKLVSLGADVTLRDNDNNTVYYYSAGYSEIITAIQEGLAEWNTKHPDAKHENLPEEDQALEIERSKDYKDPCLRPMKFPA